jgi:hypothetical protein
LTEDFTLKPMVLITQVAGVATLYAFLRQAGKEN